MQLGDTRSAFPHLDSLTSLRFFAAAIVFLRHTQPLIEQAGVTWTRPLLLQGTAGVSFFFILSGFVLMWSRKPGLPTMQFYRRRVARVWPNHAVLWIIVVACTLVFGGAVPVSTALANLFLLQAWSPDTSVYNSLNAVSWSLSCEMFFYLCFPALAPLIARVRHPRAAGLLVAGGIALTAAVVLVLLPSAWPKVWTVYTFPAARLLEFVLGMIAARLVLTGGLPEVRLRYAVPAAAATYAAIGFLPSSLALGGYAAVTAIPFTLLIVAAAQSDMAGRPSVLRHPALIRLGTWSYSFYLIHSLVLFYGSQLILPAHPDIALVLAYAATAFLVSTALAAALYRFVEKPMAERWSRPRKRVGAYTEQHVA